MIRRRSASGFTLLEVLISIVVLAFGLLGIAGLQVFALKNNHSSSLRTTATIIADDMIERMKTNVQGMVAEDYNKPNASSYGKPSTDCSAALCDPTQLAAYDLWQFSATAAARLPGGTVIVCRTKLSTGASEAAPDCDNDGVSHYIIKIWWTDERNVGATAQKQRFWTRFNP